MKNSLSVRVRSVLFNYDHVDCPTARLITYRRIRDGRADLELTQIRAMQVEVWRDLRLMNLVFESLWDEGKLEKYRGYLIYRGLSPQDAEDVVQSVALKVLSSFEDWRPWDAGFNTWVVSMLKGRMNDTFRKQTKVGYVYSLDDLDLTGVKFRRVDSQQLTTMDEFGPESPAAVVVEKAIAMLREEYEDSYNDKLLDVAAILEHALDLGTAFKGLNSSSFLDRVGMTRGQVDYRLQIAKDALSKAIADVYKYSSADPPV